MFTPDEIIFVPSQQCNLHCAHCYIPNDGQKLEVAQALKFMQNAADDGISRVGFSGGEPFLSPVFLHTIISDAVAKGFIFDRLMTNAVWWQDTQQLEYGLNNVYEAGFDGTIAISYDAFHNQSAAKIAQFIQTAQKIWQTRDICVLVCVRAPTSTFFADNQSSNTKTSAMIAELAIFLGIDLTSDESDTKAPRTVFPNELRYRDKLQTFFDNGSLIDAIPIFEIDYIPENADDGTFWQSDSWFTEDYCEGPGNVYYVHADGNVSSCCGYANDCPQLILGNINTDSYAKIKEAGITSSGCGFLKTVYGSGLRKEAIRREKTGEIFPGKGKTADNCLFCRHLLTTSQNK